MKSNLVTFFCLLCFSLLAFGASARAGIVVPYAINSAIGASWTGYFEITDLNVAVSNPANVISFQGNGQSVLDLDNFINGSTGTAWYTFSGGFAQFSFQSPDFQTAVTGGATWAQVNNTIFTIVSTDAQSLLMQPGFSSLLGSNGSVTFGTPPSPAVPEPGTWAAAALLAGGAGYVRWRRRRN